MQTQMIAPETKEYFVVNIKSVDAIRDPRFGWEVNNTWSIKTDVIIPVDILDSSRKLLKFLREATIITDASKGQLEVEDCSDYIEILLHNNKRPIIMIDIVESYFA
jgi:hypothetical protein